MDSTFHSRLEIENHLTKDHGWLDVMTSRTPEGRYAQENSELLAMHRELHYLANHQPSGFPAETEEGR